MALPNLLIIGCIKSGTGALHQYLSLHPQIFITELKEPRYFIREDRIESAQIPTRKKMCKPTTSTTALHVVALPAAPTTKPTDTTTTPMRKSVSFHETVDVFVISRLDAYAVRELFYRHEDYRRFRSESCLEILQAKADQTAGDPVVSVFRALFGVSKRQQWMQQHCQSRPCTMEAQPKPSPETLLRELAFVL